AQAKRGGLVVVAERIAAVDDVLRIEVVIGAQRLGAFRIGGSLLEDVVVSPRGNVRVEKIRQRENLEKSLAARVDAAGGNLVVGERRVGGRVPDGDQPAVEIERLRKIASPLKGGRHRDLAGRAVRLARPEFLRLEEEQLA